MSAVPSWWRRLAVRLARHAAGVMPGARSPWTLAMRRELDYIADDPAALRWAFGCVLASYRARLAERPSLHARTAWRQVAAGVALMLLIGVVLQDNAGGQTEPPPPALNETRCNPPAVPTEIGPNGAAGVASNRDNPEADHIRPDCAAPLTSEIPESRRSR